MRNSTLAQRLGYLFYIVSPNETSYEKLEDVPDYINEVGPFFTLFVTVELVILLYKKSLFLNDSITSIAQGILQNSIKLGFGWMAIAGYIWVYENWRIVDVPWNSLWMWWFCLVAVDLGYYCLHRASHEINILWASHQVHHSSEQYNFSTALRQSVFQSYATWMFYLPIALIVPPAIFTVHWELNTIYQFWIHTEFIKNLGPLEYILNTPSHHRVHHGRNRYCIDKNYGGLLIIWDRLFGTFEAEGEKVVYGLTHPINTFDPITIQLCHLLHIWRTFWGTKGVTNKLSVLIKGPGWEPGKPWHGNIEDIPDVSHPVAPYNPPLARWCSIYVLLHFYILAVEYLNIIDNHKSYNWTFVAAYLIYIAFTLTVFGAIFDNRPSAALLEVSRCIIYLILNYYFQPSNHLFLIGLKFFFLISALLWSYITFKTTLFKIYIKMK